MGGSMALALVAGVMTRGMAVKAWVERHPTATLPIAAGLWLAVLWTWWPSRA